MTLNATLQAQDKSPHNLSKPNKEYTYSTFKNDPTQTRQYRLENGLTVLLTQNKNEPRISCQVAVKTGSKNDPSTHTGLAHYLEHLLFKGTDKYGTLNFEKEKPLLDAIEELYEEYGKTNDEAQRKAIYKKIDSLSYEASKYAIPNEIDKMFATIGAKGTNAFTSFDKTVYVNDIPSNQLENFLKIESERYRNPQLRIFHTELETVYEEKNRGLDNDDRKSMEAMLAAIFRNHNYGLQTTIGTVDHLKRPSIREIKKYFQTYYVPNNMAVILSGDIDFDKTIQWVDQNFSYMQAKDVPEYIFEKETQRNTPQFIEVLGPTAENVTMAWRFPASNSDELHKGELLAQIMYNGKAGLLDLNVNKAQSMQSASAGRWVMKDYGLFFIDAEPKENQSLEDCVNLLNEQLDKIKKGDFDETLIPAIVDNLKVSEIRSFDSNSGRVNQLQNAFTLGYDWESWINRYDEMRNISKDQIAEFARRILHSDFVVVYKRKGEDPNIKKIEKPAITPIVTNRDVLSPFAKQILDNKPSAFVPDFVEFEKDIKKSKTKNETPLWYIQNQDNSLFNCAWVWDMGKNNQAYLPLAFSLIPYLNSEKYTAEAFSKQLYLYAGNFSQNAIDDISSISFSGLQKNFEKIYTLINEHLSTLQPNEAALKKLIGRILNDRVNNKADKNFLQQAQRFYAIYGANNPITNVLSQSELESIQSKELIEVVKNIFKYPHVIQYFGPEEEKHLLTFINNNHLDTKNTLAIPEAKSLQSVKHEKTKIYITEYDMVQAEINWIYNDVNNDNSLYPLVTAFNQYFGGGMSALVFQTIRESKALAYSTFANYMRPTWYNEPFTFNAYVGTQADKLPEAIAAMNSLLQEMPFSTSSYQQGIMSIKNKIESERIRNYDIFGYYRSALRRKQNNDIRQAIYQQIDAIGYENINQFHQQHIKGKPYTYTVLGSKSKIDMKALEALGEVEWLSIEKLLGDKY